MASNVLTIGEMVKTYRTTARTLRFYEESGLIFASRTDGNERLYNKVDQDRFVAVKALADAGIPIKALGRAYHDAPRYQATLDPQVQLTMLNDAHKLLVKRLELAKKQEQANSLARQVLVATTRNMTQ